MILRRRPGISLSIGIVIIVVLAVLPFLTNDQFLINSLISVLIFALFGASWDLSFGVAGLLNFGPGVAFGIGGFSLVLLAQSHYHPLAALLIAGGIAALTGVIMWVPSIRMSGAYLVIVTLVILLLSQSLARARTGEEGISIGINYFTPTLVQSYYYALALVGIGIFVLYAIRQTKFGLRLRAIRDDEPAAKSLGINVDQHKLVTFLVSSFFLGLAGAYYSLYSSSTNYQIFSITNNFFGIVIGVIGGAGSIFGALLGSLIVQLPSLYLVNYGSYSLIVYGLTMILIMLFVKGGLMNGIVLLSRKLQSWGRR